MSNPYREYKGITFYSGVGNTQQSSNCYGDGTVYRGVRSKDSSALTVTYQDLTPDEKREIINDSRSVRLRHGCAIVERRELAAKLDELEAITKRLALDLECVLLNQDRWWDQAHETLQAYRDMMDAWYPQDHVSPLGKD